MPQLYCKDKNTTMYSYIKLSPDWSLRRGWFFLSLSVGGLSREWLHELSIRVIKQLKKCNQILHIILVFQIYKKIGEHMTVFWSMMLSNNKPLTSEEWGLSSIPLSSPNLLYARTCQGENTLSILFIRSTLAQCKDN